MLHFGCDVAHNVAFVARYETVVPAARQPEQLRPRRVSSRKDRVVQRDHLCIDRLRRRLDSHRRAWDLDVEVRQTQHHGPLLGLKTVALSEALKPRRPRIDC